jgi:undecaprenyl-diphosphatase
MTNFIFNLSQYVFIKDFAIFLSYFYFLPVIILIWVIYKETQKLYLFSILFLSSFFTWFLSQAIKLLLKIERPETVGIIINEQGFSFLSIHSSFSMVLGIVVYSFNKKLGIFLIFSSFFIGISRVILGVHFVIDVLFGWLLGFLIGVLFIKVFKYLKS